MNYLIGAVLFVGILIALNINKHNESESVQVEAIKNFQNKALKASEAAAERNNQIANEIYRAEKIKLFVRGRDAKTCMKILKTDTLNNQVAECNKDRYVELRRDEVEKFKSENDIF